MTPKTLRQAALIFFTLLAAGLFFYITLPYLAAVVLAVTFAVLVRPLYERIATVFGYGHTATVFTVFVSTVLVVLPITLLLFWLSSTTTQIYSELQSDDFVIVETFLQPVVELIEIMGFDIDLSGDGVLAQLLSWLSSNVNALFTATVHIGVSFLIWFILLYFSIKDGHRLLAVVIEKSPLGVRATERIFTRIHCMINAVVKVSLLMGIFQGFMATIGFWIFGVPYPILLGALTTILALLPAVGVTLIMVLSGVYLFYTSGLFWAIGLLVWAALLVGIAEDILRPYIVGRYNNVHTALILLSALGGISAFGVVGLVLGPIILAFFLALLNVSQEELAPTASRRRKT